MKKKLLLKTVLLLSTSFVLIGCGNNIVKLDLNNQNEKLIVENIDINNIRKGDTVTIKLKNEINDKIISFKVNGENIEIKDNKVTFKILKESKIDIIYLSDAKNKISNSIKDINDKIAKLEINEKKEDVIKDKEFITNKEQKEFLKQITEIKENTENIKTEKDYDELIKQLNEIDLKINKVIKKGILDEASLNDINLLKSSIKEYNSLLNEIKIINKDKKDVVINTKYVKEESELTNAKSLLKQANDIISKFDNKESLKAKDVNLIIEKLRNKEYLSYITGELVLANDEDVNKLEKALLSYEQLLNTIKIINKDPNEVEKDIKYVKNIDDLDEARTLISETKKNISLFKNNNEVKKEIIIGLTRQLNNKEKIHYLTGEYIKIINDKITSLINNKINSLKLKYPHTYENFNEVELRKKFATKAQFDEVINKLNQLKEEMKYEKDEMIESIKEKAEIIISKFEGILDIGSKGLNDIYNNKLEELTELVTELKIINKEPHLVKKGIKYVKTDEEKNKFNEILKIAIKNKDKIGTELSLNKSIKLLEKIEEALTFTYFTGTNTDPDKYNLILSSALSVVGGSSENIIKDTVVEILVTIPVGKYITKFLVDGIDKKNELESNIFKLKVIKSHELTVEFDDTILTKINNKIKEAEEIINSTIIQETSSEVLNTTNYVTEIQKNALNIKITEAKNSLNESNVVIEEKLNNLINALNIFIEQKNMQRGTLDPFTGLKNKYKAAENLISSLQIINKEPNEVDKDIKYVKNDLTISKLRVEISEAKLINQFEEVSIIENHFYEIKKLIKILNTEVLIGEKIKAKLKLTLNSLNLRIYEGEKPNNEYNLNDELTIHIIRNKNKQAIISFKVNGEEKKQDVILSSGMYSFQIKEDTIIELELNDFREIFKKRSEEITDEFRRIDILNYLDKEPNEVPKGIKYCKNEDDYFNFQSKLNNLKNKFDQISDYSLNDDLFNEKMNELNNEFKTFMDTNVFIGTKE